MFVLGFLFDETSGMITFLIVFLTLEFSKNSASITHDNYYGLKAIVSNLSGSRQLVSH